MKVLIMTLQERVEHYYDLSSLPSDWQLIFSHYEKDVAKLLKLAGDAEAIFVDAIEPVPAALIEQMPRLKIIQSEGVGYEAIAVDAAKMCIRDSLKYCYTAACSTTSCFFSAVSR